MYVNTYIIRLIHVLGIICTDVCVIMYIDISGDVCVEFQKNNCTKLYIDYDLDMRVFMHV